jgi:ABC-type branched-subunit amino acid transport system ATPase component
LIVLDTLRALHEHDHQLAALCPTCERWAVLDLGRLIAEGRGRIR